MTHLLCVQGSSATMVNDELHIQIAKELGELDPSFALEDFTLKASPTEEREALTSSLLVALNSPPFLTPKRVVVVREAQHLLAETVTEIKRWNDNPVEGVVLIAGVVGAKKGSVADLAEEVISFDVGISAKDHSKYIEDRMALHKVKLDRRSVDRLAEHYGEDVSRVDNLARTLSSIFGTEALSFEMIEPYLGDQGGVYSWDLTKVIVKGDTAGSIVAVRRMLDSGSMAALQILANLRNFYTDRASLSGKNLRVAEVAKLFKKSEGATKFLIQESKSLPQESFAVALRLIAQADVDLKGGVNYGKDVVTDQDFTELTVLEVLVARLSRLHATARR
jgi:DNA polymerase III delta subunit